MRLSTVYRIMFCLLPICILLQTSHARSSAFCSRGFFESPKLPHEKNSRKCFPCSSCPLGFGIRLHCTATQDTVCRRCDEGKSFATGWGRNKYCSPCKSCGPHREVIRKCTLTKDTVCSDCKIGYYWNSIQARCEPCSWCFPRVISRYDAFRVSSCNKPEIPDNFRCSKLSVPPYTQPTWETYILTKKDTIEIEFSGNHQTDSYDYSGFSDRSSTLSNHDVNDFPSDDEDVVIPRSGTHKKIALSHKVREEIPTSQSPGAFVLPSRSSIQSPSISKVDILNYEVSVSRIRTEKTSFSTLNTATKNPDKIFVRTTESTTRKTTESTTVRTTDSTATRTTTSDVLSQLTQAALESLKPKKSTFKDTFALNSIFIVVVASLLMLVFGLVIIIVTLKKRNSNLKLEVAKDFISVAGTDVTLIEDGSMTKK